MTIKVVEIESRDLFVENDSIVFKLSDAQWFTTDVPALAARTFIAQDDEHRASLCELSSACSTLLNSYLWKQPNEGLYLFIADGPWQPNTRITRRQNLLARKGVSKGGIGIELTFGPFVIERMTEFRAAGLLRIDHSTVPGAISMLRSDQACAIISGFDHSFCDMKGIEWIFQAAFKDEKQELSSSINWLNLAITLCPKGIRLVRATGAFDDVEASIDIIYSPSLSRMQEK